MPASFARTTLTRLRATSTIDDRGVTRPDWDSTPPDELELPRCIVVQRQTPEVLYDGRQGLITTYDVAALKGADVLPVDRIRWIGGDFEVDGEVLHTESPSGRLDEAKFAITRVEG